ncbi:hypothetical protein [uncultured Sphaerochaeta sp.]|uniref:NACHT domain-containing protein n=1 Tax=uncultured Sphaerochaeta sp. TaxID=886478 RepID=UPI002A0A9413|nr:hypothetical protein [uncultured Sphaerochaeta sp.]
MGDFTLSGFSAESFEQFVRALAIAILGPGVMAFGNGPDGGREATFSGKLDFPFPSSEQWDGYGVIQAKFKESNESNAIDQEWAKKQLESELIAFNESKKRNPKPQYYIFVTNVSLSSVSQTGGKDKCVELLNQYKEILNLQGFAIWDYNELIAYIPQYDSIRKYFFSFLTSGDILEPLLKQITSQEAEVTNDLYIDIERKLRTDSQPRLEQAGDRTDERLSIANLFFDLRASEKADLKAPEEERNPEGKLPHGILFELLHVSSRKLDPKTIFELEQTNDLTAGYVLLGGPGSGKSTLCQFLVQINRAAILDRRSDQSSYLLPTRQIISNTKKACLNNDFPWPARPRYPFKIDLNRLAKALESSQNKKLDFSFDIYLLEKILNLNTTKIQKIENFISVMPLLLIFDGLDEVPIKYRSNILTMLNDFLATARTIPTSDVFIIATSRLQGYSGEFKNWPVACKYILPLSQNRAMDYIKKFAKVKFSEDDQRAAELTDALKLSLKRPLTAQLMESPLQVSFMAIIASAKGDPGENRWQLFDSYYRTIYDREQQKAVSTYNTVLTSYKTIIDKLHFEVGFWLQYKGEFSGENSIGYSLTSFAELVRKYLTNYGIEGDELSELVDCIVEAAQFRLVFLTCKTENILSFDVRSLQEYMAAECLLSVPDLDLFKNRLKRIAINPYWDNVVLIMITKCFSDTHLQGYQDSIPSICFDLNNSKKNLYNEINRGSEIAIEILLSGAASININIQKQLIIIGLELLEYPTFDKHQIGPSNEQKLASIYKARFKEIYANYFQLHLGQSDIYSNLGAWNLIFKLSNEECFEELIHTMLPKQHDQIVVIAWLLSNSIEYIDSTKFEQILNLLSPTDLTDSRYKFYQFRGRSKNRDPFIFKFAYNLWITHRHSIHVRINKNDSPIDGYSLGLTTIEQDGLDGNLSALTEKNIEWLPYLMLLKFVDNPTLGELLNLLKDFSAKNLLKTLQVSRKLSLPWPLYFSLSFINDHTDLNALYQFLSSFDQSLNLVTFEDNWIKEGLTIEDLLDKRDFTKWSLQDFWDYCFLHYAYSTITVKRYELNQIQLLLEQIKVGTLEQESTIWWIIQACKYSDLLYSILTPQQYLELNRNNNNFSKTIDLVDWVQNKPPVDFENWIDFFDQLGKWSLSIERSLWSLLNEDRSSYFAEWCEKFQIAYIQQPSKIGLLSFIGTLSMLGCEIEILKKKLLPTKSLDIAYKSELDILLIKIGLAKNSTDFETLLIELKVFFNNSEYSQNSGMQIFRTIEAHIQFSEPFTEFTIKLKNIFPSARYIEKSECYNLLKRVHKNYPNKLLTKDFLYLKLPLLIE